MASQAARIAAVILNVLAVLLLCILLATPVRRHAIVIGILVAFMIRSVIALLPAFTHDPLVKTFTASLPHMPSHGNYWRLCATNAVLYRYANVIAAAFALSVTLPMLYIAREAVYDETPPDQRRDHHRNREWGLVLNLFPFVWGIPIVVVGSVVTAQNPDQILFISDLGFCDLVNPLYERVSEALLLTAFLSSVGVLLASAYYMAIFHFKHREDGRRQAYGIGLLDVALLARFGIIAVVCIISSFIVISIIWTAHSNGPNKDQMIHKLVETEVIWGAITPNLLFIAFALQESVMEFWSGRVRKLLGLPPRTHKRKTASTSTAPPSYGNPDDPPWIKDSFTPDFKEDRPSVLATWTSRLESRWVRTHGSRSASEQSFELHASNKHQLSTAKSYSSDITVVNGPESACSSKAQFLPPISPPPPMYLTSNDREPPTPTVALPAPPRRTRPPLRTAFSNSDTWLSGRSLEAVPSLSAVGQGSTPFSHIFADERWPPPLPSTTETTLPSRPSSLRLERREGEPPAASSAPSTRSSSPEPWGSRRSSVDFTGRLPSQRAISTGSSCGTFGAPRSKS